MDLDQAADPLPLGNLAALLQLADLLAVLGVRIVEHECTIVLGLSGIPDLGDAIAALGRRVVAGLRLGGHPRYPEIGAIRGDLVLPLEQTELPPQLVDDDDRPA